jgi:hypothetical protein
VNWQKLIDEFEPVTLERGDLTVTFEYWDGGLDRNYFNPAEPKDDKPTLHLAVYRDTPNGFEMEAAFATRLLISDSFETLVAHLGAILPLVTHQADYQILLRKAPFVFADRSPGVVSPAYA